MRSGTTLRPLNPTTTTDNHTQLPAVVSICGVKNLIFPFLRPDFLRVERGVKKQLHGGPAVAEKYENQTKREERQ